MISELVKLELDSCLNESPIHCGNFSFMALIGVLLYLASTRSIVA